MTSLFPSLGGEPIISDENLRFMTYLDSQPGVDYFKMLTNLSDELEIKATVKESQAEDLPNEEYIWCCEN
jgi:hypothetical protein